MMTSSPALRFGAKAKLVSYATTEGDGRATAVIELENGRRGAKKLFLPAQTRVTVDGDTLYINHNPVGRNDTTVNNRVLKALMDLTNWNRLPADVKTTFANYFAGKEAPEDAVDFLREG